MNIGFILQRSLVGLTVFAGLLFPGASATAQINSFHDLTTSGVIRIANTQTSPPWSQLDDKNQPAGYDVDVAREIARRIGIGKVRFVADTFANFVDGLRTGKYDLVVNSMAATEERKKVVDFSVPYAPQEFRIWVNDRITDVNSLGDLAGRKVGVEAGTSNEVWARQHLPRSSTITTYENSGFMHSDLASGRIDAVIESHFAGLKEKQINRLPIHETGPVLTIALGCVAIPKNRPELLNAVNKALNEMLADGTLGRFGHKWLGADYDVTRDLKLATQK